MVWAWATAGRSGERDTDRDNVSPRQTVLRMAASPLVMAGLVPAIHVFACGEIKQDVDARHKAGHDEFS